MKKERMFFKELDPKGSNYSSKLKFYQSLKTQSIEEIELWVVSNFTITQIINLLAKYIKNEVDIDETATNKIRVTQQQFDNFFSIIKQRVKEE